MPDYSTTDLLSFDISDALSDSLDTDLIWWFTEPPIPPVALGALDCFPRVGVDIGRSQLAQFLGALITGGQVHHFKLGEGGWRASSEQESVVSVGTGSTTVSGTVPGPPLVPETITVDAGGGRSAWDRPHSPWDGTGDLHVTDQDIVGTVNYKTNAFTATFSTITPGGQDVTVTRKHRGQFVSKAEDFDEGDGGDTYSGTLSCTPIIPGTVQVSDTDSQFLTDNGAGVLSGAGGSSGTIDYDTGAISVTFGSTVSSGWYARAVYQVSGVPQQPQAYLLDLEAADDDTLAVWSKDLEPGTDMVFQGVGTGKVRITMNVLSGEASNDGHGYAPFWTEGGLFSENGVLLVYFTMPGILKTTNTIQRQIDLVV